MSTSIKVPPISVEQYEAFEGVPGIRDELIYGEIVMSPQPKPVHQQICENIQILLRQVLSGQPYVAKQNTNIKFATANSMPAPDVFIVTREVWNKACRDNQYISVPPLLMVEVISPSNAASQVERKVKLYLDNEVTAVWEVLPEDRSVLLHTIGSARTYHEPQAIPLPAPLFGHTSISDIFNLEV